MAGSEPADRGRPVPPDAAEVEARILSVLSRATRIDVEKLHPESDLDELSITSLDVINVLFEIEEEFGVEVPAEAEEGLHTVGDVVTRLRAVVMAKPRG